MSFDALVAENVMPRSLKPIEIREWLGRRSPEVAAAISARAALRALPALIFELDFGRPRNGKIEAYLPVFRALSAAWVFTSYRVVDESFRAQIQNIANTPFPSDPVSMAALAAVRAVSNRGVSAEFNAATDACEFSIEAVRRLLETRSGEIVSSMFSADMQLIDNVGGSSRPMNPRRLGSWKLWPDDTPAWAQDAWRSLSSRMIAERKDWRVWTNWYSARLSGSWSIKSLEIDRVIIAEEFWRKGSRAVNPEIIRLIDEHKRKSSETIEEQSQSNESRKVPRIPESQPAAIEPLWRNGMLVLPDRPTETDLSGVEFAGALSALRREVREIAEDISGEANIDKRFVTFLTRLEARIPEAVPSQDDLFRLGHVEEILLGYTRTVQQEWPDFLAARYHALSLQFDRTLRQSSLWRAFKKNAAQQNLNEDQIVSAEVLALQAADALRNDEASAFVDPLVPRGLERLSNALSLDSDDGLPKDAIEAGMELLAADLVESVNNTLKAIAEVALSAASIYARNFGAGIKQEAKRQGRKDGEAAFKWLRRVAIAGMGAGSFWALSELVLKYPYAFGWLDLVFKFVR